MQTAVFWGSSDDLVEIEGVKGADEFGCYSSSDNVVHAEFILSGNGSLRIIALYDGCWSFAVAPVDEDVSMPDWPMRVSLNHNGYSSRLEIDVPDEVVVFRKHD